MTISAEAKRGRNERPGKKPVVSRRTTLLGVAGIAHVAAIGVAVGVFSSHAQSTAGAGAVTLYKNPQCECCEGYASYLRSNGFAVTVIPSNDLTVMGVKYGIPDNMQPCHLSLIGGYVVGGHIPFEVIKRLLDEKPQIAGINLPGMPTGTPGMDGPKTPLTIYEITQGGQPKVYATV
jgi:hypothetical protein